MCTSERFSCGIQSLRIKQVSFIQTTLGPPNVSEVIQNARTRPCVRRSQQFIKHSSRPFQTPGPYFGNSGVIRGNTVERLRTGDAAKSESEDESWSVHALEHARFSDFPGSRSA